jgi:hypothetical protein
MDGRMGYGSGRGGIGLIGEWAMGMGDVKDRWEDMLWEGRVKFGWEYGRGV